MKGTASTDSDDLLDGIVPGANGASGEFATFELRGKEDEPKRRGLDLRSLRDVERLFQGRAATFSVRRAAELLPGDDKRNRAWLRSQAGLIRKAANGEDFVIWGEVLDRHPTKDSNEESEARSKPKRTGGLPRVSLGGRR